MKKSRQFDRVTFVVYWVTFSVFTTVHELVIGFGAKAILLGCAGAALGLTLGQKLWPNGKWIATNILWPSVTLTVGLTVYVLVFPKAFTSPTPPKIQKVQEPNTWEDAEKAVDRIQRENPAPP